MWEIKGLVSKGEYVYAIVPNHPYATKNNYVLYHRVLMENHINRILDKNELIHHKNENKKDNYIENLEIISRPDHGRLHAKKGRLWVSLRCPCCKKVFERQKRQTFLSKKGIFTACSSRCRGIFSRKIQLYRNSEECISGIKENFIKEYMRL